MSTERRVETAVAEGLASRHCHPWKRANTPRQAKRFGHLDLTAGIDPSPRAPDKYDMIWFWKPQPWPGRTVDRKGQRCRVVVRGGMNSCIVEFMDGYSVVTSRYAVRKATAL